MPRVTQLIKQEDGTAMNLGSPTPEAKPSLRTAPTPPTEEALKRGVVSAVGMVRRKTVALTERRVTSEGILACFFVLETSVRLPAHMST